MKHPPLILIDVGHPAVLHHSRYWAEELTKKGWRCLFVARDKDVLLPLLRAFSFRYEVLAANTGGFFSKLLRLPRLLFDFDRLLRRHRPQLVVSSASLHGSWACARRRIPHIAFIDTEPRRLVDAVTLPFVQAKVTPRAYYRRLGPGHYRYPGNHELAYLHPRRFRPDPSVRQKLGLAASERYAVVRFVAWKAFHDLGRPRMKKEDRLRLVEILNRRMRVFIVSERPLEPELQQFHFPLSPDLFHDALAFADLYAGEGITTAAEAAVLGVPAVLINSLRMGYCLELQRFGLLYRFDRFTEKACAKIEELASSADPRARFAENHRRFLSQAIDVSAFMAWFIERFPASADEWRANPEKTFE